MQEYLGNNSFSQSDLKWSDALQSSADQVSGNWCKYKLCMEKDWEHYSLWRLGSVQHARLKITGNPVFNTQVWYSLQTAPVAESKPRRHSRKLSLHLPLQYSSVKARSAGQGLTGWLLCPYFCHSVPTWPPPSFKLVMENRSRCTEILPCSSTVWEPGSLLLIQYPLHYRRFI